MGKLRHRKAWKQALQFFLFSETFDPFLHIVTAGPTVAVAHALLARQVCIAASPLSQNAQAFAMQSLSEPFEALLVGRPQEPSRNFAVDFVLRVRHHADRT